MFRKRSMKIIYDVRHGISKESIQLSEAVEIMAHCVINGEVDQKSKFECCLYEDLLEQFMNMKVCFHALNLKKKP